MRTGWVTRQIDDVCEIEYGTRVVQKRDGGSAYPVYGGGGATFAMDSYNRQDRVVVSRFGMSERCTRFVAGRFFLNDSGLTLRSKDENSLGPRFLDHWTLSRNDEIFALGKGSAQKNLDVPALRQLAISYPIDTEEQQRIISILDEAFEGMAVARANVELSLQKVRVLFESALDAVFTSQERGWVERELQDVCILQRGFDLPSHERIPGSFPLVSASGIIDTHCEGRIQGPGVATGRSGSIGNVFYIEEDFWPLNTVLYVKQFHGNDPRFVYWLLRRFGLGRFATGTGVPTLNRNFVHSERVTVPERSEDQLLVAQALDELETAVQRLEGVYARKLAALDELKQSLLHQAFSGAL